ncbi:hypothetical protein LCGC14_2530030 [marine sediment metagenome]|uniref:Uncharacterized protein n=1 Tax=marine sediment metagenome TaxID=412755 RepID=A0A0F9BGP7_9ZZZZ
MAKKYNEKSTLMNRMGFRDSDSKLQSHDDIILWLYQDKTIRKITENFYKSEGYTENLDRLFIAKELEIKRNCILKVIHETSAIKAISQIMTGSLPVIL